MMQTLRLVTLSLLFCAFGAAVAQTTGTINGVVTDPTGAVVPGATATVHGAANGITRTATTNGAGEYAFPALPPGDYTLTVAEAGFVTNTQQITLNVTERVAANVVFSIKDTGQQVTVTSAPPALQTEDQTLGRVVDGTEIKQLPLATRNFTQILALSPGTSAPLNDATALGRGTQNISANGARPGSNAFYIDGVDAVNIHVNSASNNAFASNGVVIPAPDAIQEFKVQTGLYDVSNGRSGGAVVALVTRSGTDQLHGSVYEFIRNDDLNANSYFLNSVGAPRPELRQNQFGATLGGRVPKTALYYFFSYQGTRQVNGYAGTSTLTLPQIPTTRTAATLGAAFAGQVGYYKGVAIAANGSNINPVAVALLNLKLPNGQYVIPSPQTSNTTGVNYGISIPGTFNEDQYVPALDYQLTKKNHITFKAVIAQQPQFNSLPSANVPGFGTTQLFAARLFSLSDTHVFTPNLVNQALFGVNRAIGSTGFQNLFPLSAVGMNRFNSAQFPDIPSITVSGNFTIGYSVNADQAGGETTYQYSDDLSWSRGRHQMQFGGEARRYQDNYYSNNRMRGTETIRAFPDFLLGLAGTSVATGGNGTAYSDIYSASVASGVVQRNDRISDYAVYAQDSWHPLAHLTINYGLRWEYIGLPVDKGGRDGAFEPSRYVAPAAGTYTSAGFVQTYNARHPIAGIPFFNNTLTNKVSKLLFGPRLGVLFQVKSWMNVRAGYALSTDRPSNQLGLLESLSLPNYVRTDLSGTGNAAATLANPFPTLPTVNQFPIVPQLYGGPYTTANPALSINDIDPNWRTPYVQQYGLNVQFQLAPKTVFETGYVGSHGIALPVETLLNQAVLASPANPVNGVTTNTTANVQSRVPFVGFSPSGLIYLQTKASSVYNSIQTSLTEQLNHGLEMLASYTYAKAMDDQSSPSDGTTFTTFYNDQTCLSCDWAPSDYNRTNRFVLSGVYSIPAFGGALNHTDFGKRAFGGWQVAGVGVVQSGLPFTITDSAGGSLYGGTTSEGSLVAGATTRSAVKSGRTENRLTSYFNTSAYTSAGFYFGNAGRNTLTGPLQRNIDVSLIKTTPIYRHTSFEFRAEFFNVLNFVNFANPASAVSTATSFGVISAQIGNPRILQFAGKVSF